MAAVELSSAIGALSSAAVVALPGPAAGEEMAAADAFMATTRQSSEGMGEARQHQTVEEVEGLVVRSSARVRPQVSGGSEERAQGGTPPSTAGASRSLRRSGASTWRHSQTKFPSSTPGWILSLRTG